MDDLGGIYPTIFGKFSNAIFLGKLVLEAVLIGRDRKGDCFLFDGLFQNFMHSEPL